jgi:hypothetical protein
LDVEERAAWLVPWVEELPRAAGLLWLQRAAADGDMQAAARAEANLLEAARRAGDRLACAAKGRSVWC